MNLKSIFSLIVSTAASIAILNMPGAVLPALAEEPAPKSEMEKARRIRAILNEGKFSLVKEHRSANLQKFCTRFIDELRRGSSAITFVEPIVSTDDLNHLSLTRYQNECRRDLDHRYVGLSNLGDWRFRLYRLEFDGNPKNGPEELIYAENEYGKGSDFARHGGGGYYRIDFKKCDVVDSWLVGYENSRAIEQAVGRPIDNYSAIIRRQNHNYILSIMAGVSKGERQSYHTIYIYDMRYRDAKPARGNPCSWVPGLEAHAEQQMQR